MPGSVSEPHKLAGLGIPMSEKIAASTVIIVTSLEVCAGWAIIGELSYLRGRNRSINY